MENEEGLSDWVLNGSDIYNFLDDLGLDEPVSVYLRIQSVKSLGEIGVNVNFYNRNKIVHPYGK